MRSHVHRRLTASSLAVAAVITMLSLAPGAARAGGDAACLAEEYVPESGVALSIEPFRPAPRAVQAFGVGTDRQVWTTQISAFPTLRSTGWRSLGGLSLYGPAAVFSGTTSHVAVVGGDGAVWLRSDDNGASGGWSWLGGQFVSSPAIASLGPDHLRVFGAGLDGALWTREFDRGAWSGWSSLGGQLASAPVATTYPGYGQVEVSVVGVDGYVYTMGVGRGAVSGAWIGRDFTPCSVLATPSVSANAFPGDRVWLDSRWGAAKVDRTGGGSTFYGGVFRGNPDIEFDGAGFQTTVLAGIGTDGAMFVSRGLFTGWTSLGGQFI